MWIHIKHLAVPYCKPWFCSHYTKVLLLSMPNLMLISLFLFSQQHSMQMSHYLLLDFFSWFPWYYTLLIPPPLPLWYWYGSPLLEVHLLGFTSASLCLVFIWGSSAAPYNWKPIQVFLRGTCSGMRSFIHFLYLMIGSTLLKILSVQKQIIMV